MGRGPLGLDISGIPDARVGVFGVPKAGLSESGGGRPRQGPGPWSSPRLCLAEHVVALMPEAGSPQHARVLQYRELLDALPMDAYTHGCILHPELTTDSMIPKYATAEIRSECRGGAHDHSHRPPSLPTSSLSMGGLPPPPLPLSPVSLTLLPLLPPSLPLPVSASIYKTKLVKKC